MNIDAKFILVCHTDVIMNSGDVSCTKGCVYPVVEFKNGNYGNCIVIVNDKGNEHSFGTTLDWFGDEPFYFGNWFELSIQKV